MKMPNVALITEILGRTDAEACDLALIHGWGIGKAVWQPVIEALAPHFRIHLVDLPGYGTTAANSHPSFAETAQQLINALPVQTTLCGWSLGSQLALKAALIAPQRVRKLVLVGATPSFRHRDDWREAQPPSLLKTFSAAISEDARTTLQRFVALLNQGDTQARSLGRTMIKQTLSGNLPDTTTLLAGLDWLRDVDLRKQISATSTPVLLIHGENDPLMPLAAARWLDEKLPNSRLEIFTGAAHAPFLNNLEHFSKLIGDYCYAFAPH